LGAFKNLITERTVEEVQVMIKDNLESNAIYWKILWGDSKRRLKKAEKILKEIRENSNPSYLKDRVDEYFKAYEN
tara:strand:- start:403 stop:627 length:225 start_codon:yes stop_codon:yes gene_type:complete